MTDMVHNVSDRRRGWIGPWEVEPLTYESLTAHDVGRTVIYRDDHIVEAGTLSSWRDGLVWARYSTGDTAAASRPENLCFGLRSVSAEEMIDRIFARPAKAEGLDAAGEQVRSEAAPLPTPPRSGE